MSDAKHDANRVPTLIAVSSSDGTTPVVVYADPTTHRLLTQASGGAAPDDATFVTLSTNASLTNERVLTGTANQIMLTDNGAGSTIVLSLPQSIAATSSPTFKSLTLTAFSVGIDGAVTAAGAFNKVTITPPASGSTLTIADGKTLTVSDTMTLAGPTGTGNVVFATTPTITTPVFTANAAGIAGPSGFLINGKFVPSVASNNLTVAIKGCDGNDPSSTNPVYCRIGDTMRSITSALSVTANAGTNWCNAGGAELATQEVDYFVYLGYNATDGVVLGFSRIIANHYFEFSQTSTDETYCKISTIANAANNDDYALIGRFPATLSAGAGYTWTVPTFLPNNLIQHPVYATRWHMFTPTITGYSSNPTSANYYYRMSMNQASCVIQEAGDGTSNATTLTYTLPWINRNTTGGPASINTAARARNNTADLTAPALGNLPNLSRTMTFYSTYGLAAWTNTGGKRINCCQIVYDIDKKYAT